MAVQTINLNESVAAKRRVYFKLVDSTDGLTPETGEAGGRPQISKNGENYENTAAVLIAISSGTNGSYYVELELNEVNTAGKLLARYKSANTVEFEDVIYIQEETASTTDAIKQLILTLTRKVNYLEWKLKQTEETGAVQEELSIL